MRFVETIVRRDAESVVARLAELATDAERLLRVRDVALHEASNATPFHCTNAGGTFAYQHGVFALRQEHVDIDGWRLDRSENVEGIVNEALSLRILFSNVDVACHDDLGPKPRSAKGSGSERVCAGNLFGHLPEYAPEPSGGMATYYLMIDESGAAELTRPVVSGGTFKTYVERIWLSSGVEDDRDFAVRPPLDSDDAVTDFDPQVARKQ